MHGVKSMKCNCFLGRCVCAPVFEWWMRCSVVAANIIWNARRTNRYNRTHQQLFRSLIRTKEDITGVRKTERLNPMVQTVYRTLTAQPSRIQRWAKGKFAKVRVVCFCWRNIVMFAPRTYTHIPTVNVVAKRHAYMIFHSIFPLFTSFRCDF